MLREIIFPDNGTRRLKHYEDELAVALRHILLHQCRLPFPVSLMPQGEQWRSKTQPACSYSRCAVASL